MSDTFSTSDLDPLRQEIAEALGYAVKPSGDLWALVCPDGKRKPNFGAEWAAWSATPDWPRNTDAALALWDTVSDDWTPRLVRLLIPKGVMTYGYKAAFLHNETHEEIEAIAETPAEAVARAWLAWRRAGEKTEG